MRRTGGSEDAPLNARRPGSLERSAHVHADAGARGPVVVRGAAVIGGRTGARRSGPYGTVPVRDKQNLNFEWDPRKAAINLFKHGVSFEEALTVFADPLARIFDDEEHSTDEQREIIIGHSARWFLLVVCFSGEDRVRIFSARRATKRERRDYEENIQS